MATSTTTTTTAKPCIRILGPARYLVESTSRPGLGHQVDVLRLRCGCEAGKYGRRCRHLVLTGTLAQDWLALYGRAFRAFDKPAYGTTVDYTRPPAHPSPALSSSAYVGAYHNDFFGEMTIAAHGGGLVLTQGPHKAPFPLRHFARNVFTYQPVGENAYGLSAVTFTVGAGGKATRVVVENLDIHGQGTFTRDPL